MYANGPEGKEKHLFFVPFLRGTGAKTRPLQDVLVTLLHYHSAKMGKGFKFSHPREHPEPKTHCRYFNQQATIDSNMSGARYSELKRNATNYFSL